MIAFTGIRGVVSLAAALSIPLMLSVDPVMNPASSAILDARSRRSVNWPFDAYQKSAKRMYWSTRRRWISSYCFLSHTLSSCPRSSSIITYAALCPLPCASVIPPDR